MTEEEPRWELPVDPDLAPGDPRQPSPFHRARLPAPARRPSVLAAIFAGGALGTAARYAVEAAWPARAGHFPVTTWAVNTLGAFLLGFLLTVAITRRPRDGDLGRFFLGTGLLGGWTTYSTMAVEAVDLGRAGHLAGAAGYLAVTLVCGLAASAGGIALGRRTAARAGRRRRTAAPGRGVRAGRP